MLMDKTMDKDAPRYTVRMQYVLHSYICSYSIDEAPALEQVRLSPREGSLPMTARAVV